MIGTTAPARSRDAGGEHARRATPTTTPMHERDRRREQRRRRRAEVVAGCVDEVAPRPATAGARRAARCRRPRSTPTRSSTSTAPMHDRGGQLDQARSGPGGARGGAGSSTCGDRRAVAARRGRGAASANSANASEPARRAEQRRGPQPLGAAALHRRRCSSTPRPRSAPYHSPKMAPASAAGAASLSPSSSDGQQPGSCTARTRNAPRRAERGEHVVGAARRGRPARRWRRRTRRRTRRARRPPSGRGRGRARRAGTARRPPTARRWRSRPGG